jgi:hypothetical protein
MKTEEIKALDPDMWLEEVPKALKEPAHSQLNQGEDKGKIQVTQ